MTQTIIRRFFTAKTLIRIAFAVISLNAIAQAQPASKSSPPQSGNNYNYTSGGGG